MPCICNTSLVFSRGDSKDTKRGTPLNEALKISTKTAFVLKMMLTFETFSRCAFVVKLCHKSEGFFLNRKAFLLKKWK